MNDQPRAVALNLTGYDVPILLSQLRNVGLPALAAQIEAQTKPPRMPEPGLWGVVKAHRAHHPSRDEFFNCGPGWLSVHDGTIRQWAELRDPILVREGVES